LNQWALFLPFFVMAGLDPAIQILLEKSVTSWMAASGAAMTE